MGFSTSSEAWRSPDLQITEISWPREKRLLERVDSMTLYSARFASCLSLAGGRWVEWRQSSTLRQCHRYDDIMWKWCPHTGDIVWDVLVWGQNSMLIWLEIIKSLLCVIITSGSLLLGGGFTHHQPAGWCWEGSHDIGGSPCTLGDWQYYILLKSPPGLFQDRKVVWRRHNPLPFML